MCVLLTVIFKKSHLKWLCSNLALHVVSDRMHTGFSVPLGIICMIHGSYLRKTCNSCKYGEEGGKDEWKGWGGTLIGTLTYTDLTHPRGVMPQPCLPNTLFAIPDLPLHRLVIDERISTSDQRSNLWYLRAHLEQRPGRLISLISLIRLL